MNRHAVDLAARAGLVAYGVVHLLIAWLALQLAFGDRQGSASGTGAVRELAQQPFGEVLVWLIAAGMAMLVVWQLLEAAVGHRARRGPDRVRKRVGSLAKSCVYGYLAVTALTIVVGAGSSSGGTDSMTARLMELPAGQLLVGAVGGVIIGVGCYLVWKGLSEGFRDDLTLQGQNGDVGTALMWLGKAGYTAKGVALGIVGVLFGYAAVTHDPQRSGGLDQALQQVLQQPFGPFLLTAIAAGIGCFGLFCFGHARHLSR